MLEADPVLIDLLREVADYPSSRSAEPRGAEAPAGVLVPLRIEIAAGTLAFFSTTTVFGTPVDVTLSELAIESFFAADATTAEMVRELSAAAEASTHSSRRWLRP